MSAPVDREAAELTAIELAILHALAAGDRRIDIVARLGVPRNTVNTGTGRLYAKLGATCALHAVATALRMGLLDRQPATESRS